MSQFAFYLVAFLTLDEIQFWLYMQYTLCVGDINFYDDDFVFHSIAESVQFFFFYLAFGWMKREQTRVNSTSRVVVVVVKLSVDFVDLTNSKQTNVDRVNRVYIFCNEGVRSVVRAKAFLLLAVAGETRCCV